MKSEKRRKEVRPPSLQAEPTETQAVEALRREFIRKVTKPVTERDNVIVMAARQLAQDRYARGIHHLAACGWGRQQAAHYSALQLNCKRARESSVCAEAGILMAVSLKSDELLTIVTFHGNHENHNGHSHEPYVVPPCAMCATRFQRFAPNCEVIVEFEDKLVKIPQSALMLIPYPMTDMD
jgi:cytidine deaminase